MQKALLAVNCSSLEALGLKMPRGRPKKQLQAIQEDEILEDVEQQEETAPAIDEEKLKVIQQLEAEGETGPLS